MSCLCLCKVCLVCDCVCVCVCVVKEPWVLAQVIEVFNFPPFAECPTTLVRVKWKDRHTGKLSRHTTWKPLRDVLEVFENGPTLLEEYYTWIETFEVVQGTSLNFLKMSQHCYSIKYLV